MKLGNLIKITSGYPFPSSELVSNNNGTPVIKIKELKSKTVVFSNDTNFYCGDKALEEYCVTQGDILVAMTGNPPTKPNLDAMVGRCSRYPYSFTSLLNQRICKVESKSPLLLTKYLYYWLSRDGMTEFLAQSSKGSANQANISNRDILSLEIDLVSVAQQSHIVDILGTLDDKIENLEEINSKLQNYCIAKYRLLFSDVESIPLSNIAAITMGQSPAGNTLNDEDGVVFYQGRTDFGFRYPTVRLFTTDPKRMAKAGDILLSVRAPVGDVNIAAEDCCIGRGIAAVSSEYNSFVYYSILNQKSDFDIYNNSGTIFGSINRDALSAFKIPAANISLIETFESMASNVDIDAFYRRFYRLFLNVSDKKTYVTFEFAHSKA